MKVQGVVIVGVFDFSRTTLCENLVFFNVLESFPHSENWHASDEGLNL